MAHQSQLHAVPDDLSDEAAVLAEPMARALHAARRAAIEPGDQVLVSGAGTFGLFVTLALRQFTPSSG